MIHSCQHCTSILLRPFAPTHKTLQSFRLPHSPHEALAAAESGCSFFQLLTNIYLDAFSAPHIDDFVQKLYTESKYANPDSEDEKIPFSYIYHLALGLSRRPFVIRVAGRKRDFEADVQLMRRPFPTFVVTAEPDDPAAVQVPIKPIDLKVSSHAAFTTSSKWLEECVSQSRTGDHAHCQTPTNVFVPTRLLEVTALPRGDVSVKLSPTNSTSKMPYACLSYCWGGDQPLKTVLANIKAHETKVDTSHMPQTLIDALKATLRLDLRHIWIDCLCIIQDSPQDLIAELADMPKIYSNAFVTISAANAKTCFEGFLQDRESPYALEVELKYLCKDKRVGKIRLSQNKSPEDTFYNIEDPIDTRAWTFQERTLSPRILEYGTRQLRWRCQSLIRHDGGEKDRKTDAAAIDTTTSSLSTNEILVYWNDIIYNYTRRQLSFPGDKLVACAAVAERAGTHYGLTYAAGLWTKDFAMQLMWQIAEEPMPRPSIYRAPSWSWASVDGPVWNGLLDSGFASRKQAIEILECKTTLKSEKLPFGAVTDASLRLRGRVKRARWYYNDEGLDGIEFSDLAFGQQTNHTETATELSLDALEEWWAGDEDAWVDVLLLRVWAPGVGNGGDDDVEPEEGNAGVILVDFDMDGEEMVGRYRRIGVFMLPVTSIDVFEGVVDEEITVV